MKRTDTTVVIGAGPYGLSVAAHLRARNIPVHVLGKPLEFWQKMPSSMCLKSPWSASSLSAPGEKYNLDHYIATISGTEQKPIPLPFFLDYCRWFQEQAVPEVDPTYVQSLAQDGQGFRLELADGRSIEARNVIVATGIAPFTYIPPFARDLPSTLASHTQAHTDLSPFKGRTVAVVGRGQSALDYAAFLHEAGATVEVIARGPIIWINRRLYEHGGVLKHIFYPPSDVGPPGINWLIAFPLLFRLFPEEARSLIDRRAIRPAVAQWLRPRVEGKVRLTPGVEIVKAEVQGEHLHCKLSDGTTREIDHLFLGTGYRPDVSKLPFIDPALHKQIQSRNGFPVQNEWFESSVPHLYFAGALAGYTFGPICRFVTGAGSAARQITRRIAQEKRAA
ncbi:MAG: NAD(P)/FAD-dependent oxidoreductase [Ktedonobacteraceae bacterium]|nr:NAD(P)/FAD-dependent oxidoreductase [Ktedonobacteraceae bacterium]